MRRLETRVLTFRYLAPMDFVTLLTDPTYNYKNPDFRAPKPKDPVRTLIPPGLVSLSPDNLRQELTVRGDDKALAELEALQRLLDVKNKELIATLVVGESKATAQVANNQRVRLSAFSEGKQYCLDIAPHINGDGSVSFFLDIPIREGRVVIRSAKAGVRESENTVSATFRRVALGEPIAFTWDGVAVTLVATPVPV